MKKSTNKTYSISQAADLIGCNPQTLYRQCRAGKLGRKRPVGIRLTPDAIEFCRQHLDGFTVLENKLRASKEFREWNATPTHCSDCGRSLNETGGGNCATCEGA